METALDVNVIASEFIGSKISDFFDTGKNIIKGASEKVMLQLRSTYSEYFRITLERHSKSKSFFIRNEPTLLYDFYIPMGLLINNNPFEEKASILGITSKTNNAILTGAAGCGKSIMLKHLFIDCIRYKYKVPVLIELRSFNQSDLNLYDLILESLLENHLKLDTTYISKAIESGHFVFFLDGFDEIDYPKKKLVAKQIREMSSQFSKNAYILSSRPDNEFAGWQTYTVFEVSPLSKKQACELVIKLPFDTDIKQKFLKDLSDILYDKHTSFLSNPLLLSIMLLTYGQSADIPSKLSIFYNQAFEALFQRHDALKGAYQRKRLCKLDIQDFAKVFSVFCIQTYDKRIFQFSHSQGIDYLSNAKEITHIEYKSEEYLSDAIQSVCLLVEDGLLIAFPHRSFQEYFAARFINDQRAEIAGKLMYKYAKYIRMDSVIRLLYEINPDLVEREFIIPKITELMGLLDVKNKIGIRHFLKYIKMTYKAISIEKKSPFNGETHFCAILQNKENWSDFIHFVLRYCGHYVNWSGYNKNHDLYNNFCKTYLQDKDEVQFPTSKMKTTDTFLRKLSQLDCFISMVPLTLMLPIKDALQSKSKGAASSLNSILLSN